MTRPAPRAALPGGGLPARWAGECAICKQAFPKDTPIVKVRGQAAHVECYREAHL